MDRLLKVGDIFSSKKLNDMLYGEIVFPDNTEPFVKFDKLHTEDYNIKTSAIWTEKREGGWTRSRTTILDTKAPTAEFKEAVWEVVEIKMTGGGTAMGPNDVYPDGYWVFAKKIDGKQETVNFYQTGCFRGMIDPKDITLSNWGYND